MTTMVTVVESSPPVLVAVTVYVAEGVTAVGVPDISPVEVSRTRPAGSDGETAQDTTGPPLEVGVTEVMLESFVRVNELVLYETEDGIMSLTTIVTDAVALPPVFVAVTV